MKMPRTFRGPILWLCFSDEASASQYEHNTRGHSVPLEDTTRREGVPREHTADHTELQFTGMTWRNSDKTPIMMDMPYQGVIV